MPYGIAKSVGGDDTKNVARMEKCIASVMAKDNKITKQSAIKICKSKLFGSPESKGYVASKS